MSAISDIRHRHLLFWYRRQIYRTEKRHSDIGSVPISTSEFIPISDIEENIFPFSRFESTPLEMVSERYNTKLLCLSGLECRILDKTLFRYPISCRTPLSQSDITDYGYRTKCPPMAITIIYNATILYEIRNKVAGLFCFPESQCCGSGHFWCRPDSTFWILLPFLSLFARSVLFSSFSKYFIILPVIFVKDVNAHMQHRTWNLLWDPDSDPDRGGLLQIRIRQNDADSDPLHWPCKIDS
jgi:hypothetical protein